MKKTKEAPEDEMILAELIAAASEHGLTGCKEVLFKIKDGGVLETYCDLETTCEFTLPDQASSCCVLGAQELSRFQLFLTGIAADGNDASEDDVMPYMSTNNQWEWNIGATFNIAMETPN